MNREEILYKTSRTGTTAIYFVPNVTPEMVPTLQEPGYLVFNNLNIPVSFSHFNTGMTEIWSLQDVGDYQINVPLTSVTNNYLTGYSMTTTFNNVYSSSEKDLIRQRFSDNVISTITAQTQISITYPTYVFFVEQEIDDMYANISLTRSYETLDTLQIYNKPINSIPLQEARTGVLFGKLQAIQTVKDENGNNFKIPLRNVPVGIFNPSSEYSAPMSLDANGDRFFINFKESSLQGQYFNVTAYTEDNKFLRSQSQYTTVPDKFKYVTFTNENGEFVIYNAPIGNGVVVFEVDLFKQGLTKDEIVLNNFPFPTNNDANIGEFPCYYYNQVPVDVMPAWGYNQTGYTELNINVNLDLRKWATYIFPPAAYGNEYLETTVAKNYKNTFKIQVKDMTNFHYQPKNIEIVQVPNDLDRQSGSEYLWYNELLSQRQQVEFFKFGCHVVKLPANIYDPLGFRTDADGIPMTSTSQQGVWLAAYQFNAFVDKTRTVMKTGASVDWNGGNTIIYSHFDVNNNPGTTSDNPYNGLGVWPYEKPWSASYPEPYKIPAKPTQKRFNSPAGRTYISPYITEEPVYSDGDLVGAEVLWPTNSDPVAGGFGVQEYNGVWFPNQIAYVATESFMYKYEGTRHWSETYANGFNPYWSQSNPSPVYATKPLLNGMSSVINGEKFQRVECGYGYFMRYRDWPRVVRMDWGIESDVYRYRNLGYEGPGTNGTFYSLDGWTNNVYNLEGFNFAYSFEKNNTNSRGMDLYRIVHSGPGNIKQPENFTIPTYVQLTCDRAERCCADNGHVAWGIIHQGEFEVNATLVFPNNNPSMPVWYVESPGSIMVPYVNGTSFNWKPGGRIFSYDGRTIGGASILLPGNAGYDSTTNKNTLANYGFEAGLATDGVDVNSIAGALNSSALAASLTSDPFIATVVLATFIINANNYSEGVSYFYTSFSNGTSVNSYPQLWVTSIGTGGDCGIYHNGLNDSFQWSNPSYFWRPSSSFNNDDNTYPAGITISGAHYTNYQGGFIC